MSTGDDLEKNDQARARGDRNAPGEWPGSGTTVEGKVETATSGIGRAAAGGDRPDAADDSDSRSTATTSGHTIEPDDVPAEQRKG
jgi:hypothetical protein